MLASDDFVLTDYCHVFAKVYELIGSRWVDQGTAYCHGQFIEETNQAFLIARAEEEYERTILSTAIRCNDVYQRQQDTLIVWTEPDGVDYALSFQDAEGCAEVWNFIIEVQHHINSSGGFDSSSPNHDSTMTATILRTGHLPMPELGNVADIERSIKALARGQHVKEKICDYIQRQDYIKAMINVLNVAEDLESLDNLHALCSLMQTILMLNDHGMYEHILDDDKFFGVVGMLEYDPEFPTHKANYREFLHLTSRFHQPIPIPDESIQKKVHNTYRLQFLKDVVLARALDDSTFNVLNSCIIFNQIDIITHVQNDPMFMREIVSLYDVALRREVVVLIQQLCAMGKNVQLPARMALFRTLVDCGVLFAVQWALGLVNMAEANLVMISTAGEVLSAVLEHDLVGVRNHVLKQVQAVEKEKQAGRKGADKAETLLALMCRVLAGSRELAVQSQVGDALRTLLEISVGNGPETPVSTRPL
ncbi:DUF625-domain-containing protein [Coniophora puteana RWD-64-598 SS2]|uniref:DUF625-domain-containing protein n=1 Tax=Coniophora puteana (strain RWD-64-598) TaxID=741705 RepID=A0A5M3MAV6_CONPW|nr:DUF625-domain-containing protein [Coniophora puteana RWD-64-598 SS2]EIW76187.1 DUF625-domain-containing protein [Coniophora puteana RWD-64-598 SS2]